MSSSSPVRSPFWSLNTFSAEDQLNVIIDTPKGSRNKYKYDPALGLFKLSHLLTAGMVFPYDFGYLPSTKGGDGDPLDVMVLMDEPVFVGCLVTARLIGVIEAEQTEQGKTMRNDRFLAVAAEARLYRDVQSIDQINARLLDELEHFFGSYNEMRGKQFKPLVRSGPVRARQMLEENLRTQHLQTA
ncbi:MAG: inorganic diphosphatase [Caldilineaceae bacterium]